MEGIFNAFTLNKVATIVRTKSTGRLCDKRGCLISYLQRVILFIQVLFKFLCQLPTIITITNYILY